MSETVKVNVDTEVEAYPVLSIREAEQGSEYGYEIPRPLLEALDHAQEMVEVAEAAIMERIGATYPDAGAVADWLKDREDDAVLEAARAAYAVAHPDGPDWQLVPVRERQRLIDAAKAE